MRRLVLAASLCMAGCSIQSNAPPPAPAQASNPLDQSIERGVTTKEQVLAVWGNGATIEPMGNGYERWTYRTDPKTFGGKYLPGAGFTPVLDRETVTAIVFDERGIVYDYTSSIEWH